MKTKALIIGGGIAGLTLALLLGKTGLSCIIVDKAPILTKENTKNSGRTVALMNSSVHILKATGIWGKIAPSATPLRQMRLKDDGNPYVEVKEVNFPASDIGLEQFGYNIPNLPLQMELQQAVNSQENITYITEDGLESYQTNDHTVRAVLESGTEIEADIIIGCDGRHSKVRDIAGIHIREEDYGQSAITCIISHTKPHDFTSTEHHRPGGPFTIVPLEGNSSSIVWVEKTDEAQRLLSLPCDLFEKALQDSSRDLVGTITLETSPESWPLKKLIADRLIAPRTAIAAESAHVISPIGAQGLNLSLRDIATLAETIIDAARSGEDIGSHTVLKRYEKRRKADVITRVEGIDRFNKIVSNNIGFLRGMRRSGLMALNVIPPLKQFVMHQGLAPAADEGRLMRGEAL